MNPAQAVATGAVAIAVTGPVMSLFVPNVYEVRSQEVTHNADGIRHAVAMGSAVSLGVGIAGSIATGNAAPFVGAAIGVAIVWAIYEWALRNPHKGVA